MAPAIKKSGSGSPITWTLMLESVLVTIFVVMDSFKNLKKAMDPPPTKNAHKQNTVSLTKWPVRSFWRVKQM